MSLTRFVKEHLTELAFHKKRPPEHVLETLATYGFVDNRGHITPAGQSKANELMAAVQANRARD